MRRFAMAALAVVFATLAHAEGISRTPQIAAPPNWNRSGLYVAALAGYNTAVLQAEGLDLGNGKLLGGAAVGYNYRFGSYMGGIEADWLFTDLSASENAGGGITVTASNKHLASVRARAGLLMGPAMLFVTAGPAWQHARVKASDGVTSVSDDVWQLGMVGGGGIELEVTRSFAVRLEALHYVFGKDGSPFDEVKTEQTVARAAVIFKF